MLFVVGFVLMGYEMLGSRYLNPYFGGGITTWACLIAVVLLAMMVGYMTGGVVGDRNGRASPLVWIMILAGASMLVIYLAADWLMVTVLQIAGDGFWGTLLASVALAFFPVALLSACSPYTVKLLLNRLDYTGRITGIVYSVSTAGNISGTLVTTFLFIPSFGTRTITVAFASVLFLLGIVIFLVSRFSRRVA
jgi:MFS family permease